MERERERGVERSWGSKELSEHERVHVGGAKLC